MLSRPLLRVFPTTDLTFYVTSMRVKDIVIPTIDGLDYLYNSSDSTGSGGTFVWYNQGTAEDDSVFVWSGAQLQSDGAVKTVGGSETGASGGVFTYAGGSQSDFTVYLVFRVPSIDSSRILQMYGNGNFICRRLRHTRHSFYSHFVHNVQNDRGAWQRLDKISQASRGEKLLTKAVIK